MRLPAGRRPGCGWFVKEQLAKERCFGGLGKGAWMEKGSLHPRPHDRIETVDRFTG